MDNSQRHAFVANQSSSECFRSQCYLTTNVISGPCGMTHLELGIKTWVWFLHGGILTELTATMQTVPTVPQELSGPPESFTAWEQREMRVALNRQGQAQAGARSSTGMQSSGSGRTWTSLIKARPSCVTVTYATSERKRDTQIARLFLLINGRSGLLANTCISQI